MTQSAMWASEDEAARTLGRRMESLEGKREAMENWIASSGSFWEALDRRAEALQTAQARSLQMLERRARALQEECRAETEQFEILKRGKGAIQELEEEDFDSSYGPRPGKPGSRLEGPTR